MDSFHCIIWSLVAGVFSVGFVQTGSLYQNTGVSLFTANRSTLIGNNSKHLYSFITTCLLSTSSVPPLFRAAADRSWNLEISGTIHVFQL